MNHILLVVSFQMPPELGMRLRVALFPVHLPGLSITCHPSAQVSFVIRSNIIRQHECRIFVMFHFFERERAGECPPNPFIHSPTCLQLKLGTRNSISGLPQWVPGTQYLGLHGYSVRGLPWQEAGAKHQTEAPPSEDVGILSSRPKPSQQRF